MIRLIATIALSLTIVSCCGCKVNNAKQKKMLSTTQWQVVGTENDSFTINFDPVKGEIFGRGACNSYFGAYTTEGKNGITIEPRGMTRMACNDDGAEQRFIDMLAKADEFAFDGKQLVLLDDGATIATFASYQE
ncbi:MAG: META domain-containing protein [Rikenellaceae bacterium]